jgi:hypothetical protein
MKRKIVAFNNAPCKNAFGGDETVFILLHFQLPFVAERKNGKASFSWYIVDKERVDAKRFCTGAILHHGVAC